MPEPTNPIREAIEPFARLGDMIAAGARIRVEVEDPNRKLKGAIEVADFLAARAARALLDRAEMWWRQKQNDGTSCWHDGRFPDHQRCLVIPLEDKP